MPTNTLEDQQLLFCRRHYGYTCNSDNPTGRHFEQSLSCFSNSARLTRRMCVFAFSICAYLNNKFENITNLHGDVHVLDVC